MLNSNNSVKDEDEDEDDDEDDDDLNERNRLLSPPDLAHLSENAFHDVGPLASTPSSSKVKKEKKPKERKKHCRFNGMSDEEVAKRLLPDLIVPDLDILIVSAVVQH